MVDGEERLIWWTTLHRFTGINRRPCTTSTGALSEGNSKHSAATLLIVTSPVGAALDFLRLVVFVFFCGLTFRTEEELALILFEHFSSSD